MSIPGTPPNICVIEGFFGHAWSWRDRREYAPFLRDSEYRCYIYAPKDDPFIRKRWREDWPSETATEIEKLIDVYHREGLKIGVGLSPYEVYLNYDEAAREQLRVKIAALNAVGPDVLCILFDDMRGDVPDLARLQTEITHQIAEISTADRIIMCPSYYSFDPVLENLFGTMPDNYLQDLGRWVDREIDIFWTGPRICSDDYPDSHLLEVNKRLQRKPFLWDNYPVNDGAQKSQFLHLRAFENRSHRLRELTAGHAVNPMNQAWLSRIPLRTLPVAYSQGEAYCAETAFTAACRELCRDEVAAHLEEDLGAFQDIGLQGMTGESRQHLIAKYRKFPDDPCAREIVAWLNGDYAFDPACLTD